MAEPQEEDMDSEEGVDLRASTQEHDMLSTPSRFHTGGTEGPEDSWA